MGRWDHYDSDEYRLPEGMKRVAYDADREVYTYEDSDGSYWEGDPGSRYGRLHRVGGRSKVNFDHTYPREGNVHRGQSQRDSQGGYSVTVPARKGTLRREGDDWGFLDEEGDDAEPLGGTTMREPSPWRMFAPFLMLVCLVLLLVFRFLSSSGHTASDVDPGHHERPATRPAEGITCNRKGQIGYRIREGDTCWDFAQGHNMSLDELLRMNKGMDCNKLRIGSDICVKHPAK